MNKPLNKPLLWHLLIAVMVSVLANAMIYQFAQKPIERQSVAGPIHLHWVLGFYVMLAVNKTHTIREQVITALAIILLQGELAIAYSSFPSKTESVGPLTIIMIVGSLLALIVRAIYQSWVRKTQTITPSQTVT